MTTKKPVTPRKPRSKKIDQQPKGYKGFVYGYHEGLYHIIKNGLLYGTAESPEQCVAQIDFYHSQD